MKEKVAGFLILILLITAILPRPAYCADIYDLLGDDELQYTRESFNQLQNSGKANKPVGGGLVSTAIEILSPVNAVIHFMGSLALIPAIVVQRLVALVGNDNALDTLTIKEIVFNECKLLDVNYTDVSTGNNFNVVVKQSVMKWFYALRNLSIGLELVVLIYIGIRMMSSTIAADKAKYKNMLINWFVGFGLIFVLQYFITFGLLISKEVVGLFAKIGTVSFETDLIWTILNYLNGLHGVKYVALVIFYIVVVYFQVKFFLLYIRRFLSIGFLITISPLITLTYPIDKVKDNKAQALDAWTKEFITNLVLQPIHAGTYLVFITTANEIFKIAPILSLIMFIMLSRVEKFIKNIFGLKNRASIKDMEETLSFK